ncbi:hypothetical protein MTP04_19130 [Lysinibacillus sp. PLM2]|nr:hypothetical protein MTP04_19130 [Lysinibacillus sp. PLM2]
MFFKKKGIIGEKNGVSYINGEVGWHNFSLNVYSYLIDGILIDTGAHSLHKYFKAFIDEADFDQVMITHHHEDHTGNAAYIEKTKKVPIYLSDQSIDYCSKRADYPFYRKAFWGSRKPFHAKAIADTFISRTATWDVIDTPGHAFDHKAFLNRETGQLFTGDLFVLERTRVILTEESIPTIIQSLEKILTYDFKEVICQHAGFLENGRHKLEKKREFLLSIQHDVLFMYEKGFSIQEICQILFPKKYPIIKISRGEWDSKNIVTSILTESQLS